MESSHEALVKSAPTIRFTRALHLRKSVHGTIGIGQYSVRGHLELLQDRLHYAVRLRDQSIEQVQRRHLLVFTLSCNFLGLLKRFLGFNGESILAKHKGLGPPYY